MIAIDYTAPERRLREALNDFLNTYFTGTPHTTPTGDRTFPDVDVLFNQAKLPDSTKPQIHLVWQAPRLRQQSCGIQTITVPGATTYTGTCDEASGPWDIQVFIRVKDTGVSNAADHLCAGLGSNFEELFRSSEVNSLALAGFGQIVILSGPTPLQSAGWQVRMLTLRGTVTYFIPRG